MHCVQSVCISHIDGQVWIIEMGADVMKLVVVVDCVMVVTDGEVDLQVRDK